MPTFGVKKGVIQQIHCIQTLFEPDDLGCYRSLLPNAFSMPTHPEVFLYVLAFDRLAWPGKSYLEGVIGLNSVYQGQEGFYIQTMPVTSWLGMLGGRLLGFPKYVADQITLETSAECSIGEVKHHEVVQLRLEFIPGLTRNLSPWEQTAWDKTLPFNLPVLLLFPAEQGPTVRRAQLEEVFPGHWERRVMGMVHISTSPMVAWSGLAAHKQSFPGMLVYWRGGANIPWQNILE
jgi:acetoacetate decarboxylase